MNHIYLVYVWLCWSSLLSTGFSFVVASLVAEHGLYGAQAQ